MSNFRKFSNREEMVLAGWKFSSAEVPKLFPCRECAAWIEWVQSPNGNFIPIDAHTAVIHFDTCSPTRPPASQRLQPSGHPQASPALEELLRKLIVEVHALVSSLAAKSK